MDRDSYTKERKNNYSKSISVDEFMQHHHNEAVKKNGKHL
jgi:hypothetical protein